MNNNHTILNKKMNLKQKLIKSINNKKDGRIFS
jgi:hypothetical protein